MGMRGAGVLIVAVLVMTACRTPSEPVMDEPAATEDADATAGDEDVDDEPAVEGTPVTVRAEETGPYEGLQETLPAGVVTFTFEMEDPGDRTTHDFRIEELDAGTPIIAKGQSAQLTVELEPGTYTAYCSVGTHRERGMESEFVVEEAAG